MRRKRLGETLRNLREANGHTLTTLAAELGWSHTKLSRLENAKVRPDVADVMDLLEVLGVTGEQERRLISLARQANQRGWWRAYAEMPARQAGYAELESSALTIAEFALVYVPGLLQTEDYARVRFADGEGFPSYDREAAVKGRLERQQILAGDKAIEYTAVLDEGVLRRETAPQEVMLAQLHHLAEVGQLGNVHIVALPFSAAVHNRPLNSFTYYSGPPDEPSMVSAETETSDVQLGDPEDVSRYQIILERLLDVALSEGATRSLVQTIIREKQGE